MSNYDKFLKLFTELGYSPEQVEQLWDLVEEYDDSLGISILKP